MRKNRSRTHMHTQMEWNSSIKSKWYVNFCTAKMNHISLVNGWEIRCHLIKVVYFRSNSNQSHLMRCTCTHFMQTSVEIESLFQQKMPLVSIGFKIRNVCEYSECGTNGANDGNNKKMCVICVAWEMYFVVMATGKHIKWLRAILYVRRGNLTKFSIQHIKNFL